MLSHSFTFKWYIKSYHRFKRNLFLVSNGYLPVFRVEGPPSSGEGPLLSGEGPLSSGGEGPLHVLVKDHFKCCILPLSSGAVPVYCFLTPFSSAKPLFHFQVVRKILSPR